MSFTMRDLMARREVSLSRVAVIRQWGGRYYVLDHSIDSNTYKNDCWSDPFSSVRQAMEEANSYVYERAPIIHFSCWENQ